MENSMTLPSTHQIGDAVDVDFENSKHMRGVIISAVKFTDYGKVTYDICIPVGFELEKTTIEGILSDFVKKPNQ